MAGQRPTWWLCDPKGRIVRSGLTRSKVRALLLEKGPGWTMHHGLPPATLNAREV